MIVDRLLEFRPDGVPAEVVWPAYEPELFTDDPPDRELRRRLGIADDESVLVYAGNAHASNAAEMRSLYLAVAAVNRDGPPAAARPARARLRPVPRARAAAGRGARRPRARAAARPRCRGTCASPTCSCSRAAPDDVQRVPLPVEAAGVPRDRPAGRPPGGERRPVPRGRRASASSSAAATRSRSRPRSSGSSTTTSCASGSGAAARAFAERTFSWAESARTLRRFYDRVARRAGARPARSSTRTGSAPSRRGSATRPSATTSTRSSACRTLATASRDLKDVQRPWVLKAIVGAVAPGLAAARDRRGRAGRRRAARAARLRRDRRRPVRRPRRRPDRRRALSTPSGRPVRPRPVPGRRPGRRARSTASTRSRCSSTSRSTRSTSCAPGSRAASAPAAARSTRSTTSSAARATPTTSSGSAGSRAALGIDDGELDETLARLADDPETYFLSAESHNRWRGGVPYDEFPMRRCVSIQLCVPVRER